jgi:hypothetical protein
MGVRLNPEDFDLDKKKTGDKNHDALLEIKKKIMSINVLSFFGSADPTKKVLLDIYEIVNNSLK